MKGDGGSLWDDCDGMDGALAGGCGMWGGVFGVWGVYENGRVCGRGVSFTSD